MGAVTETPSAGLNHASMDFDVEEVQATRQEVRFTLQGDCPSKYIGNTPSEAGRANHIESPDYR